MKIINSKFKHDLSFEDYFINENSCFLDIETLGLNRNKDMIYLVGVLYFNKKEGLWNLDQYFSECIDGEKSMLIKLVQAVRSFHTIITYNGNAFDLPYLNNRFHIYNINFNFSQINSLDLYAIVRKNKQYLNLENYKLKTLERFIGIYREDIYSGRDCIDFYKNYLITKDKTLKRKILQHNYDDLFYMLDLFKILDILKHKKTVILNIMNQNLELILEEIRTEGDFLIIQGLIEGELNNKINYYGENYKFLIEEDNRYLMTIEYKKGLLAPTVNCLFIYNEEFSIDIVDESEYPTPNGVILLQVEKNFIIHNIKNLIEQLVKRILI